MSLSIQERQKFEARIRSIRSIDPTSIIPQEKRSAIDVTSVRVGGVLRCRCEVYVVVKMATYTETNDKEWKSTELVLFCLRTGGTRYLEWEEDDEVEVSFVERKLTTRELNQKLQDDEGGPFDIDEDIDEACEHGWGIRFNGRLYDYDDDWPVRFESSDGRTGRAYFYEFGSEEDGWLTIEGWQDGEDWDYEGYLSVTVHPQELEIISLGA